MGIEVSGGSLGSAAWKFLNTGLGAAGTAMSATALGSKCSEQKVREIFREEMGRGYGYGNGCGRSINDTVIVSQPCSENTCANRFEMEQSQRIALLEADKYTDQKIIEAYKQSVADNKALEAQIATLSERNSAAHETIFKELVASRERQQAEICRLDKEMALNKQATDFGFVSANQEFARINGRLNDILKEVIPLSAICPQPMPGCIPVGFQGQVVNTTATGETNTVIMANKAAKQQ